MAIVTFTRDDTSLKSSPLNISFSISGSAEYNVDYNIVGATSINNLIGVVTIPANQLSTSIQINSFPDSTVELDEAVVLTVIPLEDVYDGLDSVTYTILNDDQNIISIYFIPTISIKDITLTNIASGTKSVLDTQINVASTASINYLNETLLLLHFDENNGTALTDSSADPIIGIVAPFGVTNIRSKFGVSSISLTTPRDCTVPYAPKLDRLLSKDFQFDAWYFSSVDAQVINKAFFRKSNSYDFSMLAGGELSFSLTSAGIVYSVQSAPGFALANRNIGWHHAAATRIGNTLKVFVDGVLQGTSTLPSNLTSIDTNTNGGYIGFNDSNGLAMNIDELRITTGNSPYSANFTSPAVPFIN